MADSCECCPEKRTNWQMHTRYCLTGAASVGCRLCRKVSNIYCLEQKCERMTNKASLSPKYSLRGLNPMAK